MVVINRFNITFLVSWDIYQPKNIIHNIFWQSWHIHNIFWHILDFLWFFFTNSIDNCCWTAGQRQISCVAHNPIWLISTSERYSPWHFVNDHVILRFVVFEIWRIAIRLCQGIARNKAFHVWGYGVLLHQIGRNTKI